MGRLKTAGAESLDVNGLGIEGFAASAAGATISTLVQRTGLASFKVTNNSNGNNGVWSGLSTDANVLARSYFFRMYFRIEVAPSSVETIFSTEDLQNAGFNLQLGTDQTIQLRGTTTTIGSPSAALALNTWYRVEVSWKIGSGSLDDSVEFRLDGATIASSTNGTWFTVAAGLVAFGAIKTTSTGSIYYFDDVALNDDQGASQNSWPGAGSVALLLPISDSAVGAGWTLGTGTAISANGFGSVDNTPPTGVADLAAGSDPKQIRNASANANTNYDANLTTYFNAGIGPNSVVNVLVPIVATAAPVTTSSKQGTVGIVSNPTIANIALGAGGTAGAFWSGAAGAGYATGWKVSFGTTTYAPAVTVTTSPVMRITQVTSSTRIAVVCFMGMYVDYTPGGNLPGTGFGKTSQVRGIRATIARSDFW
jgi:hypothetical protein